MYILFNIWAKFDKLVLFPLQFSLLLYFRFCCTYIRTCFLLLHDCCLRFAVVVAAVVLVTVAAMAAAAVMVCIYCGHGKQLWSHVHAFLCQRHRLFSVCSAC